MRRGGREVKVGQCQSGSRRQPKDAAARRPTEAAVWRECVFWKGSRLQQEVQTVENDGYPLVRKADV